MFGRFVPGDFTCPNSGPKWAEIESLVMSEKKTEYAVGEWVGDLFPEDKFPELYPKKIEPKEPKQKERVLIEDPDEWEEMGFESREACVKVLEKLTDDIERELKEDGLMDEDGNMIFPELESDHFGEEYNCGYYDDLDEECLEEIYCEKKRTWEFNKLKYNMTLSEPPDEYGEPTLEEVDPSVLGVRWEFLSDWLITEYGNQYEKIILRKCMQILKYLKNSPKDEFQNSDLRIWIGCEDPYFLISVTGADGSICELFNTVFDTISGYKEPENIPDQFDMLPVFHYEKGKVVQYTSRSRPFSTRIEWLDTPDQFGTFMTIELKAYCLSYPDSWQYGGD